MKRILKSGIALFLLAVLFFVFPKSASFSQGSPPSLTPNQIIDLTNKVRSENNLPVLKVNPELMKAAELKAEDMKNNQYFSHVSPSGKNPWEILDQENYFYQVAGENLAINYNSSQEVINAWLASASHKANILDPNYQEIGVAVIPDFFNHRNSSIIVQYFGALFTIGG